MVLKMIHLAYKEDAKGFPFLLRPELKIRLGQLFSVYFKFEIYLIISITS